MTLVSPQKKHMFPAVPGEVSAPALIAALCFGCKHWPAFWWAAGMGKEIQEKQLVWVEGRVRRRGKRAKIGGTDN